MNILPVLIGLAIVILGLGTLTQTVDAQTTGAQNGQGSGWQRMVDSLSSLFNMPKENVQQQLETKTPAQIALEKGMSLDQWKEQKKAQAQARWAEKGLSTEEIAKRIQWLEERQKNCDDSGMNRNLGGYGKQFGGRGVHSGN